MAWRILYSTPWRGQQILWILTKFSSYHYYIEYHEMRKLQTMPCIVIEVHGHKSLISVEYEKSAAYIHNKINKYDDAILRICRRKPHIAALSSQKGWFDAQWPNIQNYTETWPCICYCVSFGSSDAVTSNHRFVELSTAAFCNQWTFCLIEFSDISLAWQYLVDGFVMWWVWDMLH